MNTRPQRGRSPSCRFVRTFATTHSLPQDAAEEPEERGLPTPSARTRVDQLNVLGMDEPDPRRRGSVELFGEAIERHTPHRGVCGRAGKLTHDHGANGTYRGTRDIADGDSLDQAHAIAGYKGHGTSSFSTP